MQFYRNIRFTTLILSTVLLSLGLISALLIIPTYQGATRAYNEELKLTHKKDQEVLNHVFREALAGLAQVAEEVSASNDLLIGVLTENPELSKPVLETILAGKAGERIDAFVLEYSGEGMLRVDNVGLTGLSIPLEQLSARLAPYGNWNHITASGAETEYGLLRLTLPVIESELGEIVGRLHTYILINENFWILNELQRLTGAMAVTLNTRHYPLGSLGQAPHLIDTLQQTSIDAPFALHPNGVINQYQITLETPETFHVRALISDTPYQILQAAYSEELGIYLVLAALLALGSGLMIHRTVRLSLNNLIEHAEAVIEGKDTERFSHTFSEFRRVSRAFTRMLASLHERDSLIAGIMNNSNNMIFVKSREGRYLLANQSLAHLGDKAGENITGLYDVDLFPDALLPLLKETDQKILSTGNSLQFEFTFNQNGVERTFLTSKFPLFNEQGEPYAVGGISADISERKQAEERLQLAQQVFDSAAEAFVVVDGHDNIVTCNRSFLSLAGEKSGNSDTGHFFCRLDNRTLIETSVANNGFWQGESDLIRQHKDALPILLSVTRTDDKKTGAVRYIAVFSDITKLKKAETRLEKLAHYDDLTGLPNRTLFYERLDYALTHNVRAGDRTALLFMDVDRFKAINDTYGHDAGDQLLITVAQRISDIVRRTDTLCRLGGDEFTVLLTNISNPDLIEHTAQRILEALRLPIEVGSNTFHITGSIGIALYPEDGLDCSTLLKHADIAMYHAKDSGRNSFQFFDAEMNIRATTRGMIEEGLRQAIVNDELYLQYQPRFDVDGSAMTGAEALVRWCHPQRGIIPPGDFIPIAESSSLILEIGRFVLNTACAQASAWLQAGHQVPVSVNLSTAHLRDPDVITDVAVALERSGLPASMLELEITETHVIEDIEHVIGTLNTLRAMGVHLSVDDFGTGYSSLIYLKKLPVNTVKIDRSFVNDIPGNPDDESLIKAIISMSHSLNLSVVAEGVENREQLAFLKELGCNEIQGFLLARPDSAEQLMRLNQKQGSPERA